MKTIRSGCRALGVGCLLAGLGTSSFAQEVKLLVKTVTCASGKTAWPIPVQMSIFDADKVPEIARRSKEIYESPSCRSANTVDRCLELYVGLRKLVDATPALVRVESLRGPEQEIMLPPVQQVLVFAFDKSGADLAAYIQERMAIASDEPNEVVLDFRMRTDAGFSRKRMDYSAGVALTKGAVPMGTKAWACAS